MLMAAGWLATATRHDGYHADFLAWSQTGAQQLSQRVAGVAASVEVVSLVIVRHMPAGWPVASPLTSGFAHYTLFPAGWLVARSPVGGR